MQLSEIEKYLLNFFLRFWNLHEILKTLEKKTSLRDYLFSKV